MDPNQNNNNPINQPVNTGASPVAQPAVNQTSTPQNQVVNQQPVVNQGASAPAPVTGNYVVSSSKNNYLFLFIVILLILLGVGGYILLNQKFVPMGSVVIPPTNQQTNLPTPSPTTVITQTAEEQEVQNIDVGDINTDFNDIEKDMQGL